MMNKDESDLVSVSEFSQEEDGTSVHENDGDLTHRKKPTSKKADQIGEKESKSVFRAKMMVYLVLICACVTTSILIYFYIKLNEQDTYQVTFVSLAGEIGRSSQHDLEVKYKVLEGMSATHASYARDKGLKFPNVTLPDFEVRCRNARQLTGSDLIMYAPMIPENLIKQWLAYAKENSQWVQDGLRVQGLTLDPGPISFNITDFLMSPPEDNLLQNDYTNTSFTDGYVAPLWQTGPSPINASIINADLFLNDLFQDVVFQVFQTRTGVISGFAQSNFNILSYFAIQDLDLADKNVDPNSFDTIAGNPLTDPSSFILDPVFEVPGDQQSDIVGFYYIAIPWEGYFQKILPRNSQPIEVVISDNCNGVYTYVVTGEQGVLKGRGDLHDPNFDNDKITYRFQTALLNSTERFCTYAYEIYPTAAFATYYETSKPVIFAIVVATIFVFTAMVFLVYDWAVQRRQWMIIRAARKTQAIVSSLFPKNVQERILKDVEDEQKREAHKPLMRGNRTKAELQNFLRGKDPNEAEEEGGTSVGVKGKSKPIADLFPEATIIFADIVGFTAWSSTREPSQVFQLLETIYSVFDDIASRRRVFKVETVGDCYVAVAGLPEPRKDHAIVMARFARDCLVQFNATVKAMVVELGPDTEELGVRIGLHSGPVTAGVLRGERARFQLFGDTVNTTARMESTGQPNKIHISQETADLLTAAGKSQWLRTRREKVIAKGKGELQTYWLDASGEAGTSQHSGDSEEEPELKEEVKVDVEVAPVVAPAPIIPSADKYNRLVAWNCDILAKLLTQIVACRESRRTEPDPIGEIKKLEEHYGSNRYVLSEVQEIVRLPKFEADSLKVDPWSVKLNDEVVGQLKDYVQTLAAMYRDNPFHNFEHASHVTMSVMKLLSRIVAPDMSTAPNDTEEALHDHTYGITSDPMTQFAVALSALIHDVDHPGVPNAQLIKEQTSLAAVYRNKSIAEQNSVDLAWDLLMDDAYADLRRAIYITKAEFMRFRQLVVNIVLATDIMDKDLGALRKGRWNKAFSGESSGSSEDDINRKATIVMEHLIQASDVAHTMQHWHIYRKWNQRLFKEMYQAWLDGRAEKDPSENWYNGEKGFFDFYIIPLAKKLKDCGVFGVSSDEYLQYAVQNRKEWELKGQELVAEMLQVFRDMGMVSKQELMNGDADAPEQAPALSKEKLEKFTVPPPERAPAGATTAEKLTI